ncbi:MAG: biotin--[acetyl-CoA-carboxylase] ligase [Oscillospiraceae bacterium]|nr:biotin--[acetyl-CoA-carboxylase] ligase [Oscillospiraceae bacterium]
MGRERVYQLLQNQNGKFFSGQEISKCLGISRAAVWKSIDRLRKDGYIIEARTGLGYRLSAAPDTLVEREIRHYMRPDTECPDLRCLEEIDSTNSYLKREALLGAPHKTAAAANHQTAGRGRRTRGFVSPPGKGVYLSVLLRPRLTPEALLGVTGMAAVAVCNAVERTAGVRPGIKWTNDLVLNGKKICGILTELSVEAESSTAESLIIGAGVNVSQTAGDFGEELAAMATSLALEGRQVPLSCLAAAMIEEIYALSDALGGDIRPWVDAYRRDCVTLGKQVRLLWTSGQTEAFALDIDSQFGLIVRLPDGSEETVRTGEVSVRGMYGYSD